MGWQPWSMQKHPGRQPPAQGRSGGNSSYKKGQNLDFQTREQVSSVSTPHLEQGLEGQCLLLKSCSQH